VILLFPDGRVPSPRWRPVLWAYLVVVAVIVAATYAAGGTALAGHHPRVDAGGGLAAVDFPAGGTAWYATFGRLVFPVLAAFWLSFVAAQVVSWRRSSGERRQQLKWLMSGAAALAISQAICQPILNFSPDLPGEVQLLLNILLAAGAAAVPVCLGMAILKYRLYEIDRIISRTLAYAIVTGLLIGVYSVLVLLATRLLPLSGPVAVAGATLAAAALFNPLRRRVQRMVDRRFNRARYDAERTVTDFAARLKDAVDLDTVRDDLASVVRSTLEPAHLSVWLNGRG
jgi:MFS family permease